MLYTCTVIFVMEDSWWKGAKCIWAILEFMVCVILQKPTSQQQIHWNLFDKTTLLGKVKWSGMRWFVAVHSYISLCNMLKICFNIVNAMYILLKPLTQFDRYCIITMKNSTKKVVNLKSVSEFFNSLHDTNTRHAICNEHHDHVSSSSPQYRNGGQNPINSV